MKTTTLALATCLGLFACSGSEPVVDSSTPSGTTSMPSTPAATPAANLTTAKLELDKIP